MSLSLNLNGKVNNFTIIEMLTKVGKSILLSVAIENIEKSL